MPRRIFRRFANRLATLNLLFLTVLLGVWVPVQIYPIVASWPVAEVSIFYGSPHYARQSPLLNRVVFRMNGDDNAEYLLWMNPANHSRLLDWFSPANPMEVWALRVGDHSWFVTDIQASDDGIDPYSMYPFQIGMAVGGIILSLVIWVLFAVLLYEYIHHFRHRRWLDPGPRETPA